MLLVDEAKKFNLKAKFKGGMEMKVFRQAKSGIWHMLYTQERPNCNRYKKTNWKNAKEVLEKDLPKDAKK